MKKDWYFSLTAVTVLVKIAVCFQATFPIFHPKRAFNLRKRKKTKTHPTHISFSIVPDQSGLVF